MSLRRELVICGREDLWDEYCRLRKELVREKKLNIC